MGRFAKVGLIGAAIALLGTFGYQRYGAPPAVAPSASRVAASVSRSTAPPGSILDPLVPARPAYRNDSPESDIGDWVKARPRFQYSHGPNQRGGVEPCATQPLDTSAFSEWAAVGRGRFVTPKDGLVDATGSFDLILHLHGEEPVLRELVNSEQHFVLYTLTLPPDQGYAPLFSGTRLYESILAEVEQAVSKRAGKPARARHVVLSAWSAGFVGIAAALGQAASKDVDAVVLIDGLHAPRSDREAFKAQLQPFVNYAARAAAGERFMFVSHSSIDPPSFASTTECAHYLVDLIGGRPQAVKRLDAFGLELVEYFTRGDFHVRGYAGNDKADHCAQLATLRDVYGYLGRRWSPSKSAQAGGTGLAP